MPDLTPETLAELRRKAEAATPGPWVSGDPDFGSRNAQCIVSISDRAMGRDVQGPNLRPALFDVEFIAAANPAVVLALLDATAERDALAELRRLRGAATPDVAEYDLDAAAIAARNEFYGADRGPEATSEWRWVVVAALNAIKAARPDGTVAEAVPARRESPVVLALLDAAAERDALAAKVEATPKTPLPALGDTSGTPSMISGRVCRILGDRTAPMPPIERVGWYRELARMLSVAADKWERHLAEEAARADQ